MALATAPAMGRWPPLLLDRHPGRTARPTPTVELVTEVDIRASPEEVWAVLADFPAYPDWNPFVRAIEGKPAVGERLSITLAPPGGKTMKFRPRVLVADPGRELRWLGRLLFPGLFDGEHYFLIEPRAGGVRFVQGERFTGVLVGAARSALGKNTRSGFEAMNRALKARVEAAAA
jgi:hypothetical protein